MIQSVAAVAGIALAALVTKASAHGFVSQVEYNGQWFPAGSPAWYWQKPIEPTVGWHALNQNNEFIPPESYHSPDIVCHKSGKPAEKSVNVKAGDSITMFWNEWPQSHKGPIVNYLAACNGKCSTVDKTKLSFAKISEEGIIDGGSRIWATDQLIANNFSTVVTIPSSVKPGNYVLRHEIIALHEAKLPGKAQNYPSCINLVVTGDGTDVPAGHLGTDLYNADDKGIVFNIYQKFASYPIPGPKLWKRI